MQELILEQFLLLSIVSLKPQGFIHVEQTVMTLMGVYSVALWNDYLDLLNV